MDKTKRDAVLGLVFFVGLALLMAATILLSDLSLKPGKDVTVYLPNARGLATGDQVLMLGTKAGQVTSVDMDPSRQRNRVKVVMHFERELNLKKDVRFEIRDANFLGGKLVEIDPGRAAEPADMSTFFEDGQSMGNAFDRLADMITGGDNAQDLSGILKNVNKFFTTLNEEKGSIQKLLKSEELYNEIRDFVASLQKSSKALEDSKGVVGRLIHDEKLANSVDSIVKNFDQTMAKISSGEGPLGKIIYDEELAKDMTQAVDDIAKMTQDTRAGRGTLGMLIYGEEFKARIQSISKKLDDPNAGLLGGLLGDKELLADGKKIVANLSATTEELRTGNGLLARLIRDEELGEQFSRVLNQVTRAVEDAREAAPIGTIFQVFAGAF